MTTNSPCRPGYPQPAAARLRSLQVTAARQFLFDAPREPGLPSGKNMRRSPAQIQDSRRVCLGLEARLILSRTFVVLVLLALCQAASALPRREKSEIHKQIEALEQQWRNALVTNNVGQMDHLLADDYIGITSNGTVETKTQALDQRRAGTVRITKLDLTDTHVRVYGDTAVVTSLADVEGTNGASNISGEYRYTRVYARRLGQWKIVSFEASRMHDVDARAGKH
ncbi:MAG TPA: nuclear transport factor 2 family protein [Acidobacteriaceae bacterium]|nr:nuclear transport factor 2 family protein [Acidobacteriaceae bacterium]